MCLEIHWFWKIVDEKVTLVYIVTFVWAEGFTDRIEAVCRNYISTTYLQDFMLFSAMGFVISLYQEGEKTAAQALALDTTEYQLAIKLGCGFFWVFTCALLWHFCHCKGAAASSLFWCLQDAGCSQPTVIVVEIFRYFNLQMTIQKW